ncbi:hypothetical protein, partial [Burkholderia cepacia]|uniref:hypothetical protein n=1 Tax=Burkholderia cepacia TaxID=292 RepID=UPI001E3C4EBE
LAAHPDLLGCHKLWLEDVYERLAGPQCRRCGACGINQLRLHVGGNAVGTDGLFRVRFLHGLYTYR